MSRTPKYGAVLERQLENYLHGAQCQWDLTIDVYASPIEKVFVAEMLSWHWREAYGYDFARALHVAEGAGLEEDPTPPHWAEDPLKYYVAGDDESVCVTQPYMTLRDRRIRPDFAFIIPGEFANRVIVELDGHDFHERTPEQAQADKSRDRELQSLGWHVLRFTGREVLRNPHACLHEATALLFAKRLLAQRKGLLP